MSSRFIPGTQGVLKEQTVNITGGGVVVPLTGAETYTMVVLPANGTAYDINVALRYASGGDLVPAMVMPMSPLEAISATKSVFSWGSWGGGTNHVKTGVDTSDYTNRVFFVPCAGAVELYLQVVSGPDFNGAVVRQIVGPTPYVSALTRDQRQVINYSDRLTLTTSYGADTVLGGSQNIDIFDGGADYVNYSDRMAQIRVRGFTFTDYAMGVGDFDLAIGIPGDNSVIADADPFDMDYGESIYGYFEFRASPTGDQRKTYNFGAGGGIGCQLNGLDIVIPHSADEPNRLQLVFVNRAGAITPSAGNCWYTITTEI